MLIWPSEAYSVLWLSPGQHCNREDRDYTAELTMQNSGELSGNRYLRMIKLTQGHRAKHL